LVVRLILRVLRDESRNCSDSGAIKPFILVHSQAPQLEQNRQNSIGLALALVRTKKGWTQEELAQKAQLSGWDVSRATISKIEAGLRRVYDSEVWHFARILGCDIPALYPPTTVMKKTIPPTEARRK
jgi:DNA-binding XRE family transcriptional regulator